ncbi:DUF4232 domain-containing protein [Streptomyces poonensis]|nr:DUF4232 domain-containing protein [Streptomyces poonensis]
MHPIRRRTASLALVSVAVTLAASGCGLSEEVERELDPVRTAAAPGGPGASGGSASPDPSPSSGIVRAEELPTVAPPQGAPTPTPAPTTCPASGVRIHPGLVEAAMGLRAMTVTLTNCGEQPYRLNGYPELQVLDEQREALDVRIIQGAEPITTGVPDPGPHPVTLRPGESARTGLVWRNTVTDVTTNAVNGPYLRVTPAEGESSQVLTVDGGVDLGNTGRLGATAWEKDPG